MRQWANSSPPPARDTGAHSYRYCLAQLNRAPPRGAVRSRRMRMASLKRYHVNLPTASGADPVRHYFICI